MQDQLLSIGWKKEETLHNRGQAKASLTQTSRDEIKNVCSKTSKWQSQLCKYCGGKCH